MGTSCRLLAALTIAFGIAAGRGAPVRAEWWTPEPGTSWQIQFTGRLDTSLKVEVFDIDLWDTSAAAIDRLQADGRRVIYDFSAGAREN